MTEAALRWKVYFRNRSTKPWEFTCSYPMMPVISRTKWDYPKFINLEAPDDPMDIGQLQAAQKVYEIKMMGSDARYALERDDRSHRIKDGTQMTFVCNMVND